MSAKCPRCGVELFRLHPMNEPPFEGGDVSGPLHTDARCAERRITKAEAETQDALTALGAAEARVAELERLLDDVDEEGIVAVYLSQQEVLNHNILRVQELEQEAAATRAKLERAREFVLFAQGYARAKAFERVNLRIEADKALAALDATEEK